VLGANKMRKHIIIFILFFGLNQSLISQETFDWKDTIFTVGQSKNIVLRLAFDGPCTVYPCYNYAENKTTYDTLINFLKKNKNLTVVSIWTTSTIGSSEFNFDRSKKGASGLIEELKKQGINSDRIASVGIGEAKPLITENEINKITDNEIRHKTDLKNERIEIIITSAPNKKLYPIKGE
jgi:hypothetical protein